MQRSTRSTAKAANNNRVADTNSGLDALADAAVTALSHPKTTQKAKQVPKDVPDPAMSIVDEDMDDLDADFAKLASSDHEGEGYDVETDSAEEEETSGTHTNSRSPVKIKISASKVLKMVSRFRRDSSEKDNKSPERPTTPTGIRAKLPVLATLFTPAKKSKKRDQRAGDSDDSDSDLPYDPREPVKKRRTKTRSVEDFADTEAKFPGQNYRALSRSSSDMPNQLLLASALRTEAEPDFFGPDARKGEPHDIRGVGGGYDGGAFDWSADVSSSSSEIEMVEPVEPVKRKRGRPKKEVAKKDAEGDKGKEKEYCAPAYVVFQWPEKVPAKKKSAPAQTVIQYGDPIGPTTITTNNPADIDDLVLLLAATINYPASTIRIASLTYKLLKNGRAVGTALPLKDGNGLVQLQSQIKNTNLAMKAGGNFYFEIHMARPQMATGRAILDDGYSVQESGFNTLQVEPVNDISKLISGKKTLDEKMAPLRTHLFQLYNPGGSLHCGEPAHTEPCARDKATGLHFIMAKAQQDVLISSVLHEKNEWDVLPIGKSAFRPDKSRDFAKNLRAPVLASAAATPSTPSVTDSMTPAFMQMLMQQQQQQQMMMMQTFMSAMSTPRNAFAFGGGFPGNMYPGMNTPAMATPSPAGPSSFPSAYAGSSAFPNIAGPSAFPNTIAGPSSFPNAIAGPSSLANGAAGPSTVPDGSGAATGPSVFGLDNVQNFY